MVIMPDANIIQRSQRSVRESYGSSRLSCKKNLTVLRNSHHKSIDTTTLEYGSMWVGKCAHLRFVLATSDDATHLRLGSGVFTMAGEDEDLVAVLIVFVIVR